MDTEGTIASMATPPGRAGIGIIRMSGPEAIAIAGRIFTRTVEDSESHRILYGHIRDPEGGEIVDEVMLTVMRAPRTYTREDVVEINCHGGPLPLRRVLGLVINEGARPAEPGEFTKRAFLSGRLDLSQAEAVLDVIEARTALAMRFAQSQLKGALSLRIGALRGSLLDVCSQIEAHMDFPEEEIEPASISRMQGVMEDAEAAIDGMLGTFSSGRLVREGLMTAIVGRPNVGKSSLLNALLKEERAIVTEVPGTTRDTIEESLSIKGLPLIIMDTAGIRESHDMVEQEGVRRSLVALEDADLAIGVFDRSRPFHAEDRLVMEKLRGKKAVVVLNKSDLPGNMDEAEFGAIKSVCDASARTGEGMEELREAIYEAATGGGDMAHESEGVVITSARHEAALKAGMASLRAARASLGPGPLEITAMELREVLSHLGAIIGELTPEDILENIFSRFCIGK